MEELRDKLIERAGEPSRPPSEVKELVEAACQLDDHIAERQRQADMKALRESLPKIPAPQVGQSLLASPEANELIKASKKGKAKKK